MIHSLIRKSHYNESRAVGSRVCCSALMIFDFPKTVYNSLINNINFLRVHRVTLQKHFGNEFLNAVDETSKSTRKSNTRHLLYISCYSAVESSDVERLFYTLEINFKKFQLYITNKTQDNIKNDMTHHNIIATNNDFA